MKSATAAQGPTGAASATDHGPAKNEGRAEVKAATAAEAATATEGFQEDEDADTDVDNAIRSMNTNDKAATGAEGKITTAEEKQKEIDKEEVRPCMGVL